MATGSTSGWTPRQIAYVCADRGIPIWGAKGSSVHVQSILRRRAGSGVTVFAANAGGPPPQDLADSPVHRLPAAPGRDAAAERAQLAADPDLTAALIAARPL